MGLDNGIEVRRNLKSIDIKELEVFNKSWDNEFRFDFEIAYFRKCWNIRNDILWMLGKRFTDECVFDLTKDDIARIINIFKSYNKDNFEDSGSCIWEWDDEEWPYSEKIQRDIQNLETLRVLMDKYDLDVYFYDSY